MDSCRISPRYACDTMAFGIATRSTTTVLSSSTTSKPTMVERQVGFAVTNVDRHPTIASRLDGVHLPKLKTVNTSSTVYGDLTNNTIEFALINTRLCIGSLQVDALGNFDYLLDRATDNFLADRTYPNDYRASRLFWSMKNARRRTMYHLHIEVEQTYHHQSSNHRAIEHPLNDEQMRVEQLYEQCRTYFRKTQNEIDEHINYVDELCQKTMVNKKSKTNDASQNATGSSQGRRKNANGKPSMVSSDRCAVLV